MYTGLQASLALVIFAVSTIAVTFHSDNENKWEVSHQKFSGLTGLDKMALARELHVQAGLKFEPAPVDWMVSETKDNQLQIRYFSPNGARIVRLDRADGDIEIRSLRNSFPMYLNRMHTESFGRRKSTDSLWLWAWSFYIELSLIALLILPVTGLYIFLNARQKADWAKLSLLFSGTAMTILWHLMRS